MSNDAMGRAARFMDEFAAVFHAFSRTGGDAREHLSDVLTATATLAGRIQELVEAPRRDAFMASACRRAAATVVGTAWDADALDMLESDRLVADLGRGLSRLRTLTHDVWSDPEADGTDLGAIMSVMATLLRAVSVYDFRQERAALLHVLADRVLAMAENFADLGVSRIGGDRQELYRRACTHLAVMMADSYDRVGRRVASELASIPEADVVAELARRQPVRNEVLPAFDEAATLFTSAALAFAAR